MDPKKISAVASVDPNPFVTITAICNRQKELDVRRDGGSGAGAAGGSADGAADPSAPKLHPGSVGEGQIRRLAYEQDFAVSDVVGLPWVSRLIESAIAIMASDERPRGQERTIATPVLV